MLQPVGGGRRDGSRIVPVAPRVGPAIHSGLEHIHEGGASQGERRRKVENRGKVVSGHGISAPTHRFARALLQRGAQNTGEK